MKLLIVTAALTATLHAAGSGAFTNTGDAGPDFAVQGEYVGENCAAQVIALGDGKFHIVGFSHGLPGVAADAEKKSEAETQRDGDKVVLKGEGWKGELANGELTGTNDEGKTWKLTKTERKSPTLGAKPPAGAVVLFDGTNADAWKGGKVDAEGNLAMGVVSKQEFGDFALHLEFRTPFMPAARGQGRGNSGVYLQDRYEVQVLDSFGLKGENNECGGIYTLHKPRVNMCLPPLSWQTYDIEFEGAKWDVDGKKLANAKVTVKHNGVLIHDHAEADRSTTSAGRKDGPGPGPIQLQNHGTPVAYRNIWLVEKK